MVLTTHINTLGGCCHSSKARIVYNRLCTLYMQTISFFFVFRLSCGTKLLFFCVSVQVEHTEQSLCIRQNQQNSNSGLVEWNNKRIIMKYVCRLEITSSVLFVVSCNKSDCKLRVGKFKRIFYRFAVDARILTVVFMCCHRYTYSSM